MTSDLCNQLSSYAAYHRDPRNKLTHFVGVPLVVLSLFVALGWMRISVIEGISVSIATIFFVIVNLFYIKLDWILAVVQFPVSLALLFTGEQIAQWPKSTSIIGFAIAFVLGWIFQLTGHFFEGRRPALVDNFMQIFNAPIFLAAELVFALGFRKELRSQVEDHLSR